MIKLENLKGAAKKLQGKAVETYYDFKNVTENKMNTKAGEFADNVMAVLVALDKGETVTFKKVKNDPHQETPETLTLKGYNTLNKAIFANEAGEELVLIRSGRGKKYPKEVSNYFRISKTTAIYFPEFAQVDEEAAAEEVEADGEE